MLFGFHPDLALLHEGSKVAHLVRGASVTLDISRRPLQRVEAARGADRSSAKGATNRNADKRRENHVIWTCAHTPIPILSDTPTPTPTPYPHTCLKSFLVQAVIAGFKHYL